MTAILSPTSTPKVGFQPGDTFFLQITEMDDMDWVVDHRSGAIHLSPEVAAQEETAGAALAAAWAALAGRRRPKLTALQGGGRQTARHGTLRLVSGGAR